jgi:WD40 repeat protein
MRADELKAFRNVNALMWSPDGKSLASASDDRTVIIWNAQTGEVKQKEAFFSFNGHSRPVTSVAWNKDGTKFATGSRDETVKIWSVGSAGTFECQSTLNSQE